MILISKAFVRADMNRYILRLLNLLHHDKRLQQVAHPQQQPLLKTAKAWHSYWQAQGQLWRTEPEIDKKRQEFLTQRYAVVPDMKKGVYPFKDIKLNRADVEWLLARHQEEHGPLHHRIGAHARGLDLRGADLRYADLSRLPLTQLRGGLGSAEWRSSSEEQREAAAIHLEGASLNRADLQWASLRSAHLEGTDLRYAHLEGATLRAAHLVGNGADPPPADLRHALFDQETVLEDIILGNKEVGSAWLADIHWSGVNLGVVDWMQVKMLGDEREARQRKTHDNKNKDTVTRIKEHQAAVRANRQLATVLREQGMHESAARFAYRAQVLQRKNVWLHLFQPKGDLLLWVLRFGTYIFSWLLNMLSGYGYKPQRSLIAYVLVISVFTLAYYALGQTVGPSFSPLGALVFSITSFHGRGFFPGGIRLDDPITALAAFEAVVGLTIEVSLIATFTQQFFGR